jgi:ATP-dependent Clp protease protease subunit
MSNEVMNEINFLDDNGKLKPLEVILNQIAEIYDEIAEEEIPQLGGFLDEILSNEKLQDTEKAYEAVDFLERCLYLNQEITPEHATLIFNSIKFWNLADEMDEIPVADRIPIKIYIDTPGGDLYATLSIIDTIGLSKTPVHTITIGNGFSGGFFIGISGHKRYAFPHSSFLFHEGSCTYEGDAHKFNEHGEHYKILLKKIRKHVLNKTKIDEEFYDKIRKDDYWFTAEEAIQYGIIDEIATSLI